MSEPATDELRIFVSYRRSDSGHAGRLYDALVARFGAENVFMDVDAIDPGVDFSEVISRAVTSCDVVIALIGRQWTTATDAEGRRRLDAPDDFVRLELESALARDILVVPTCVQGAEVPQESELPPTLAALVRRQGIELRDAAWRDDVERLVRRLERLAAGKREQAATLQRPVSTRAAPAPSPSPARRRRLSKGWLAAAGAFLAVLAGAGLAVMLAFRGSDGDGQADGKPRLLALIPAVTRPSCQSIDYGEKSAQVSLSCGGARLSVTYHLFPSSAVMAGWYTQKRELEGIEPGTGSCTGSAFRGEARYAVDGKPVGSFFCFFDSEGAPILVWEDPRVGVGSEANIYEGKGRAAAESLLRQWRCCLQLEP